MDRCRKPLPIITQSLGKWYSLDRKKIRKFKWIKIESLIITNILLFHRFRSYAPFAFKKYRQMFEINESEFLASLCSQPMIELSNPGASGSIFYITQDDMFICKTVQHKEADFLQKLLPGYYMNLKQNPRTLLPKFFGLYCYSCNTKNVRIIVMNNLLPSDLRMQHR